MLTDVRSVYKLLTYLLTYLLILKQKVISCWDEPPFGNNMHGPKSGGLLYPWGAGSSSNTMWPGPRPTSVPIGILMHPTVLPFGHNTPTLQTDRKTGQTDRQRSASIGWIVLQTVAQKSWPRQCLLIRPTHIAVVVVIMIVIKWSKREILYSAL